MSGQSTVQVRRIERAGSWSLPSRTVRCDVEPRRPHGSGFPRDEARVRRSGHSPAPRYPPRPGISQVLFDFDGTLSLIRQGWPEVMVPMFTEMLPALPGETEADRGRLAFEDIMRLNGKQTIYQMMRLAARIRERGGEAKEPLWYKHEYLRRLDLRIKDRLDGLRHGTIPADDLLVHGARRLLENLKSARTAGLPGQRNRRGLCQARGRAAGPHPVLRTSGTGSTAPRMITRPSPRRWSSSG